MSIHGACHDNGMSGNCNLDCEVYLDGDCTVEDEVEERCMTTLCTEKQCRNYDRNEPNRCDSKNEVGKCSRYIKAKLYREQQSKQESNTMTEKTMNFDQAQVKGNAINALDTIKQTMITMQKGVAVTTAVKAAIKKAPGVPDGLKALMDTPYGDVLVGMILHTMAPVLTSSPVIISAVKAANVAGAVALSGQFTFIQDAIEGAISSIPGLGELGTKATEFVEEVTTPDEEEEEYIRCPQCENRFRESSMTMGLCRPCYNGLSDEDQADMSGV